MITLLKGGFAFEVAAQESEPSFPYPQPGLTALSFGLPAIVWALGIQGSTGVIGLTVLSFVLVGYLLCAWLISTSFETPVRTYALIALGLGPTIGVLLGNIGRHDFLVIFGSIILGLRGYQWRFAVPATFLMILGNPEQTLVAIGVLMVLTMIRAYKNYRRPVVAMFTLSLIVFVTLQLWARSLGIQGRLDWFDYHLRVSLLNFFGNFYYSIFAGYSVLWIFVLWVAFRLSGQERAFFALAIIAVPLLVTMTTADQTRVFVGVSSAALWATVRVFIGDFSLTLNKVTRQPTAWAFLVAAALPVFEITYQGFQRIPFVWIYDLLVNAGLISKLDQGPW